jgi:hypothetical protein
MKLISRNAQLILPALLWGLVCAAPVNAEVYRWVDGAGQTHFGARPPPSADAEWVKPPPPPALNPELGQARRGEFEKRQADYTEARQSGKEAAAAKKAKTAERKKNCTQSRKAITDINRFMNKRMLDSAGNYVDQSDRKEKLKKAQESADFWCK